MRNILLLALLIALLMLCSADAIGTSCKSSRECQPTECCVHESHRRGKRSVSPTGVCQARGHMNDKCYVANDAFLSNHASTVYVDDCPCLDGLICVDSGIVEVPQGALGKCGEKVCTGTADCGQNECCVGQGRPIGKRAASSLTSSFGGSGTCKMLGGIGSRCLVNSATGKDMNFQCPCRSGLSCQGTGVYDVPLGELGTCEFKLIG